MFIAIIYPCSPSLAGTGASGVLASCQDAISGGGQGPRLVVVPGLAAAQPYAIGKYEVRVRDFSRFCQQSGTCEIGNNVEDELPITNIRDRKSTRLNSSHVAIAYAVLCLKKK